MYYGYLNLNFIYLNKYMYIVYFRRKQSTAFYTGDITDVETSKLE